MDNGQQAARAQALELLEQRNYRDALNLLTQNLPPETDGEGHALLALAHYHLEEYASAAEQYTIALRVDAGNQEWREMLANASANAVANVDVHVPEVYHFDRDTLLAKPQVPEGALPTAPIPIRKPGLHQKLRMLLGQVIGVVATVATNALIQFVGKVIGYSDVVWTNWYRRKINFVGVLTLAYLREQLNRNNLKNTYPRGTLVGFQPAGQVPPPGVTHSRTADGSWNNLLDPKEGAAGTRFPRNVSNDVIRPETGEQLLTPNPRVISRTFLTRPEKMLEVPFLNLMAASWINFQNHDWVHHGENLIDDVHEIPLASVLDGIAGARRVDAGLNRSSATNTDDEDRTVCIAHAKRDRAGHVNPAAPCPALSHRAP